MMAKLLSINLYANILNQNMWKDTKCISILQNVYCASVQSDQSISCSPILCSDHQEIPSIERRL